MHEWLTWTQSGDARPWCEDALGYLASALVLTTFTMKSMWPLRITAIFSNVAFICYAATVHMGPVLMLHGILLPLNIFRLVQMQKERQHGNSEFMQVPELMPGSGHVVVDQACRSDRARHAIVLLSPNERRFGPDSMDRRGIGEMTSDASYDQ